MAQFVTRIDDAVAGQVDELVAAGAVESRSDAASRPLSTSIGASASATPSWRATGAILRASRRWDGQTQPRQR